MFDKLRESKLLFWSVELLVLATLIFVASKISFVFSPIAIFFSTLFAPVLIAGFFFYLLNPLVRFLMEKAHLSRNLAIILVFLVLIGGLLLLIVAIIPSLVTQVAQLAANVPSFVNDMEKWFHGIFDSPLLKNVDIDSYLDKVDLSFGKVIKNLVSGLSSSLGTLISSVANAAVVIVTVPFILFYMLKDGKKVVPAITGLLSKEHGKEAENLLAKMSETISSYISGQAIECLFVGTFTALGYWLIGVDYAFLFGCIAGVTNIIPYLGPYLGLAPAVMVTVFDSPLKALLACIVVLVVQQVDGNFSFIRM